MIKTKLKIGDLVQVMTGKSRGKTGKILQVFIAKNRVVVEGANLMKKHLRARGGAQKQKGQIIELAAPMHLSNVMLVDPSNNKPTRLRIERREGTRTRIARKTGTVIS